MNVLSYKERPSFVQPNPFDGIDIGDGLPQAIHGLPADHLVICGVTYDDDTKSLIECAGLRDMQALARRARRRAGVREINWYTAPVAACLEELLRRSRPETSPPSMLPTSTFIVD